MFIPSAYESGFQQNILTGSLNTRLRLVGYNETGGARGAYGMLKIFFGYICQTEVFFVPKHF